MKFLITICVFLGLMPALQADGLAGRFGFYISNVDAINYYDSNKEYKFGRGYQGALRVGYQFAPIRLEADFSYQVTESDKWPLNYSGLFEYKKHKFKRGIASWACLGNVLFDLDVFGFCLLNIRPYIGFGVGHACNFYPKETKKGSWSKKKENNDFCWQAIAGVYYPFFRIFGVGLEYRYQNKLKLRDHSIGLLVMYFY